MFLNHHCWTTYCSHCIIFSFLQFALNKSTFSHRKRKITGRANKKKRIPSLMAGNNKPASHICKSWVTILSQFFLKLISCMCLPKALLCFSFFVVLFCFFFNPDSLRTASWKHESKSLILLLWSLPPKKTQKTLWKFAKVHKISFVGGQSVVDSKLCICLFT